MIGKQLATNFQQSIQANASGQKLVIKSQDSIADNSRKREIRYFLSPMSWFAMETVPMNQIHLR